MSLEIRTDVKNLSENRVEIERYSKEFRIRIVIDFSKKLESVGSGMKFVDSVLKNAKFSIEVSKQDFENRHLIENTGFALGEALRKLHEKRKGKNFGTFIQSDQKTMCMFAINAEKQFGEANMQIIGKPKFDPEHFFAFFDGFAQGFGSEVNAVVNLTERKEKHLELVSKAFISSLEQIFG